MGFSSSPTDALTLPLLTRDDWEVAQFVRRRFTVYVLDSGGPLTALVTAAVALSELLYPALSQLLPPSPVSL